MTQPYKYLSPSGSLVSRQRMYQIRHVQAGLCRLCPKREHYNGFCKKHYREHVVRARERARVRLGLKSRNYGAESYRCG